MITLQLTSESQTRMDQFFQNMAAFPEQIKDDIFDYIFGMYSYAVEMIFTTEGFPDPWADLAEETWSERADLNYLDTGILEREGFLRRSLTLLQGQQTGFVRQVNEPNRLIRTGNVLEQYTLGEASWQWKFASLDQRFEELNDKRNMLVDAYQWHELTIQNQSSLFQLVEERAKF